MNQTCAVNCGYILLQVNAADDNDATGAGSSADAGACSVAGKLKRHGGHGGTCQRIVPSCRHDTVDLQQ